MSDQSEQAPAPEAKPEAMRTVKVDGSDVQLPEAKVDEMVQRGMQSDAAAAALVTERQALEADKSGFGVYQQFQQRLNTDAAFAGRIRDACADPVASQSAGANAEEFEDGEVPSKVLTEMASLKNSLAGLQAQTTAAQNQRAVSDLNSRIASELDGYPWLKGNDSLKQVATNAVLTGIGNDPSKVAATAARVAGGIKSGLEDQSTAAVKHAKGREQLQTTETNTSGGAVTAPDAPKKGDLRAQVMAGKSMFGKGSPKLEDAMKFFGLSNK